jgi:hypothetical protein
MTLKVRRVITGHDSNGKAIVKIDEVVGDLKVGRPGAMVAPIWTTEGFPVNNDGQDDAAKRQVGTTLGGGTILRVVEFSPGVQSRNHRTDSIDYAIIMSGEIDMEMDGAISISRPATCWCSAAPSTTGSTPAQRLASSRLR